MKRTTCLLMTSALAISLLFASGGPAAAVVCNGNATNAPDGRIKSNNGLGWSGINQYPQQNKVVIVGVGNQVNVTMRWRNVSGTTRTIRISHGGSQDPGLSTRYYVNGVNITSQIKESTIAFKNIEPNKSTPALVLVVKNKSTPGGQASQALSGRYGGQDSCDALVTIVNPDE